LAYLALGLFSYLETIPGPIMPFLQAELQISYGLASLHFAAFSLGSICIGLAGAQLTTWLGRQRAFWAGLVGMAVGVGLLAWCPWVVGTIAGTGVMGLAGTLLLVATQALLSDHHGEQRTIAFAESNTVAGFGSILATIAVGSLAYTIGGWHSAVALAIGAVVVLFICFRQAPFSQGSDEVNPVARTTTLRLPRRFWIFWLVLLLGSAVEWSIVFWGATFFEHGVGFEKATAAAAMSVFFVAIVIGRFIGSRFARQFPSSTILLLAQGITLIGFPLFWLGAFGPLAVLGLFIAGLGVGNFYPMALATAVGTAPHLAEQASARLTLAMGLAGLTAPVILGWLADHLTIRQAYSIVLPLLLLAGLLTLATKRGWFGKAI
ncbi:MAG: MFS transporter, partial [Chloroflexi bacterium]|nr:MFS transporter [Chloroflexota bacterium]